MKTIIIVEGKRYEAEARMYGYYDEADQFQVVSQGDFDDIEYEGRYEPIIQLLNKRIEAYEELLAEFEMELMQEYQANKSAPFANDKMQELAEKHATASHIVDGLTEGLGIVVGDIHLIEDVDLSGGDD